MKRVREATRFYTIARVNETEVDFIADVEIIEEVEMTWTEFMKYVKKSYELLRTDKRHGGMAYVR